MSNQDSLIPPTTSLLESAKRALESANAQIRYCTNEINELGPKVRAIAMKTIDVLLSYPSQSDIDRRKEEVVEQYSVLLVNFASNMESPLKELNSSWMAVEQSMGFYLLSSGRRSDSEPKDIRRLIQAMTKAQKQVPPAKSDIANLADAIKGSAGGLHGLEDPINSVASTLERLSEELEHGYAIYGRQIELAERLYALMVEN